MLQDRIFCDDGDEPSGPIRGNFSFS